MRLKIVQAGEPVLRQLARTLSHAEILSADIQRLIEDMRETMHDAPGVGLAAPQVGLSIQLAVIEDRPESLRDLSPQQLAERERKPVPFHVVINPVVKSRSEDAASFFEGCLSVAGFVAVVPRSRMVEVECLDEHGKRQRIEARGWYARILQHEIDHLNGGLYLDRMVARSFSSVDNFSRHWKDQQIAEVLAKINIES
jgi:peptide deformylase